VLASRRLQKDILGLWIEQAERSKFWIKVVNEKSISVLRDPNQLWKSYSPLLSLIVFQSS
jgi:hypothetical protein